MADATANPSDRHDDGPYLIVEQVTRGGRVVAQRRVRAVPDFATAAQTISELQDFRSVQKWNDRSYIVVPHRDGELRQLPVSHTGQTMG